MVRASDCGPEGRRFDPDIPPQYIAGIVQWLVCKFSKLEMRVRFSLPAPHSDECAQKARSRCSERFSLPAPGKDHLEKVVFY